MDSVVITGIGLVTPLGNGRESTWVKVKNGNSINLEPEPADLPGDIKSFVRESKISYGNGLPKIYPMALAAATEALEDSKIDLSRIQKAGSSVSASKPIILFGKSLKIMPPDSLNAFLAGNIGFEGPVQNIVAACATGIFSILTASLWLLEKKCDIAIAGSAESSLHPFFVAGFNNLGVLSGMPRPFDRRRSGFIMGEGAGVLVLERKSDAIARRANCYAEIAACEIGTDTNHPMQFASDGSSIASVLNRCLTRFGLSGQDVGYINLHGTGTKTNDTTETNAVKSVFGESACGIPMSSTKASTGHLLGASGSVEAGLACLAMRDDFVPPTANLEESDPECGLDYTPLKGKSRKINTAISLSFGFGGNIAAIILRKIPKV